MDTVGPYQIRAAQPEDEDACWEVEAAVWSAFHAEATEDDYYDEALHVVALRDGQVVATGNAVPFYRFDGDRQGLVAIGWGDMQDDWRRAVEAGPLPPQPRFASAVGISVLAEAQGAGLGLALLRGLRQAAQEAGYEALLAPVRPSAKHLHAGLSYADYAALRRPDGSHVDPWLRLHERAGGQIVAVCERSFVMRGSREEWQRWTGRELPEEGQVLLPGGNEPLVLAAGQGELVEGSIWVEHALGPTGS